MKRTIKDAFGCINARALVKSVAIFRIGELFLFLAEVAQRRATDQSFSGFADEYFSWASSTREALASVLPPKKRAQSTPSHVGPVSVDFD
jgi:hypothetical protein